MKQYIDKTDFVAEVERLKECNRKICGGDFDFLKKTYPKHYYSIEIYNDILSFINTLEVKEVDLEKELDRYTNSAEYVYNETRDSYFLVAKHFFELGLKAQKGGTT